MKKLEIQTDFLIYNFFQFRRTIVREMKRCLTRSSFTRICEGIVYVYIVDMISILFYIKHYSCMYSKLSFLARIRGKMLPHLLYKREKICTTLKRLELKGGLVSLFSFARSFSSDALSLGTSKYHGTTALPARLFIAAKLSQERDRFVRSRKAYTEDRTEQRAGRWRKEADAKV